LLASAFIPGLTLTGVEGTLGEGVRIAKFELARSGWSVTADSVVLELREWSLKQRTLDAERVVAHRVQIDWVASGEPGKPPATLALPFDLIVRQASIQELALGARGATPTVFRRVELAGRMNAQGVDVEQVSGEFERTRVQARGRIGATDPFATEARAQLSTTLRDRDITATVSATGSLQQLRLELSADDGAARARIDAILRVFAVVRLGRRA
jgi:translocation and assembly module TamB